MKWIIIAVLTCAFSAGLVYLFGAWFHFDWHWPQRSADDRAGAFTAFLLIWYVSATAAFSCGDLR